MSRLDTPVSDPPLGVASFNDHSDLELKMINAHSAATIKMVDSGSSKTPPTLLLFQNPYLLELILSFFRVELEHNQLKTRSTLLQIALTCKSFFDPAMDILWRELDSVLPLFYLLPTFDSTDSTIVDVVRREHLERFHLYIHRINHFRLSSGSSRDNIPNYLCILIMQHFQSTLFPRLQKLTVPTLGRGIKGDKFDSLLLAMGPSLKEVSIADIQQSSEVFVAILLYNIFMEARQLETLILSGYLTAKVLDVVAIFQHLQSLQLCIENAITKSNSWYALSNIPTLGSLSVKIMNHPPFTSQRVEAAVFNTLQTLDLDGCVEDIARILQVLRAPHLATLTIHFQLPSINSSSHSTLDSCIKQCTLISQSLRTVTLDLARGYRDYRWQILAPLSDCAQLKHLTFFCGSRSLSNYNLFACCAHGEWRELESLKILPSNWRKGDASLSLSSLIIFSEQCPRLKFLHVGIAFPKTIAEMDDLQKKKPSLPEPLHGLEELRIDNMSRTDIDDKMALSNYIGHLFQNLKKLDIGEVQVDPDSDFDAADDLHVFKLFSTDPGPKGEVVNGEDEV